MDMEYQSKEAWFPLLNWVDIPNFGYVHTLSSFEEMKRNYHTPPDLSQIFDNLLIGLRGETQLHNLLIMGPPGCGKTTFVYYLKKSLENEPKLIKGGAKFFFMLRTLSQ